MSTLRPEINVQSEEEGARGWRYAVAVELDGSSSEHEITLAWVDHDYWSGGRCAPSHVVEVLVELILESGADRPLPSRFDASTARRWHPTIDAELPQRL